MKFVDYEKRRSALLKRSHQHQTWACGLKSSGDGSTKTHLIAMAGRQRREELQQRRSGDALAHYYRASGVHAVNLKNRLRDIETDRANLALRDRGVRQKLVQLVI